MKSLEKKKIAVFYYTQSGQALNIVKSVCRPMAEIGHEIIYKEIKTEEDFPFPWKCMQFFETFPETRLGLPPYQLIDMDLSDVEDADIIIISGQSWYLSPSLPLQSFFLNDKIKTFLKGKKIINISGCRNMWVMSQRKIRKYIFEAESEYVGNIVLQDNAPNLVSVITIVRWLFYNKKEATKFLPPAGVADEDINKASTFGTVINTTLEDGKWDMLQNRLMDKEAVKYIPSVVFIEKTGHRIFGIWAKFIKQKGDYQNKARELRIKMFFYYLFFVLYVVSPFGMIVFYLTYPIRHFFIKKHKYDMCYNLHWDKNIKVQ